MPNLITVSTPTTEAEIWDSWLEPPKKKSNPVKFNIDPVILACASWRIYKQGGPRWLDLGNIHFEQQDHKRADLLRQYYAGKMTFAALQNQGLRTTFRQKLYAIVSNCHEYTDEDIGLLHRLPYLYEEDLCLDGLVEEFETVKNYSGRPTDVQGTLTLHTPMFRSRRSGEYYHYWLRMEGNNNLYKIIMKSDDPMRPLIESLLAHPRCYSAVTYVKGMQGNRNFVYYQLGALKVV